MKRILTILFIICCLSIIVAEPVTIEEISKSTSIDKLDSLSVFKFYIFSDNKGDSPESKPEFERMIKWTKDENEFVIGLGDHVKRDWKNDFLDFIDNKDFWQNSFYPNIADGENEYYGESQGDWGSGGKLLDEINIKNNKNVSIRENNCEYYAVIPCPNDYKVHLIQLHFPDTPQIDSIAFPEDSRQYLMKTLNSIEKTPKDIVIAAAHSISGSWYEIMTDQQKKMIDQKCDLVLSATSHKFGRIDTLNNEGALKINTGSITYPSSYCPGGYVQLNVIEQPSPLVVIQYINAELEQKEIQNPDYAYIKEISGNIRNTSFRERRPEEDFRMVIGYLNKTLNEEQTNIVLDSLYKAEFKTDYAYVPYSAELDSGEIRVSDIWDIFPYNNDLIVLELTPEQYNTLFETEIPEKENITLSIDSYYGYYIAKQLSLEDSMVKTTDLKQHDLLSKWLIDTK